MSLPSHLLLFPLFFPPLSPFTSPYRKSHFLLQSKQASDHSKTSRIQVAKWVPAVLANIGWTSLWLSLSSACHSGRIISGCVLFSFPWSSFLISSHFFFCPKCAQVPPASFPPFSPSVFTLYSSHFFVYSPCVHILHFRSLQTSPHHHTLSQMSFHLCTIFPVRSGCTCTPFTEKSSLLLCFPWILANSPSTLLRGSSRALFFTV